MMELKMVEIVLKKIEDGHKDQGSLENVEGHLYSKSRFFLFLIQYLGIFLRPPMFLESSIST